MLQDIPVTKQCMIAQPPLLQQPIHEPLPQNEPDWQDGNSVSNADSDSVKHEQPIMNLPKIVQDDDSDWF